MTAEQGIRLSGYFTAEQARNEIRVVVMRGATSGRRVGRNSVIEAWLRESLASGITTTAWASQIAVIAVEGDRFTKHGDSGAAGFDRKGAVLGMHTGGFKPVRGWGERRGGASDVAFITPIQNLLKDMRLHGIVDPALSPASFGNVE